MKDEKHIPKDGFKWFAKSYLLALFLIGTVYLCCYHNYYFLFVEQLQLFRNDTYYLKEFAFLPGGISAYIGNFFTQFNVVHRMGGIMISLFLTLLFMEMYLFIRKDGFSGRYNIPLLSVPCIILFYCFFDINTRVGLLICLNIVFLFQFLTSCISNDIARRCIIILLIPAVYGLAGAGVFTYVILCGIKEFKYKKGLSAIIFFTVSVLLSVLLPFIAREFTVLNAYEAWMGVSFYNTSRMPLWNYMAVFSPVVILLLIRFIQTAGLSERTKKIGFFLSMIIAVLFILFGYSRKINPNQQELYCWDYHWKNGNWVQIITLAEQKNHYDPLFINITNLALAKTDRLVSRLFDFPQRADAGSLWTSNYYPMSVTGEIYYQLDMPQVARSFFFMSNTQSPNSRSPYLYKRLAEIELLTDNEAIAEKYILSLSNTLFYKEKAVELQNMINNTQLSAELKKRKKNRPENPGFFAAEFKYNLLIQYNENPGNTLVRDYLMTQCILQNDYQAFFNILDQETNLLSRGDLPVVYQEFILMYAYLIKDNSLVTQYNITQPVIKSFYDYMQINQNVNSVVKKQELERSFGKTYWYYAQFINRIKS